MINKKGFTLIEMLVVIGIIAIALPTVFAIMFSILRQQAKVYALKQIKREGDFALSSIENNIRNYATGVHTDVPPGNTICDQVGSTSQAQIYFDSNITSGGQYFGYMLSNGQIASASSLMATVDLTSPNVAVTNLSFTCSRSSLFSPPVIAVSFTLSIPNTNFVYTNANLNYATQIKMNNY